MNLLLTTCVSPNKGTKTICVKVQCNCSTKRKHSRVSFLDFHAAPANTYHEHSFSVNTVMPLRIFKVETMTNIFLYLSLPGRYCSCFRYSYNASIVAFFICFLFLLSGSSLIRKHPSVSVQSHIVVILI